MTYFVHTTTQRQREKLEEYVAKLPNSRWSRVEDQICFTTDHIMQDLQRFQKAVFSGPGDVLVDEHPSLPSCYVLSFRSNKTVPQPKVEQPTTPMVPTFTIEETLASEMSEQLQAPLKSLVTALNKSVVVKGTLSLPSMSMPKTSLVIPEPGTIEIQFGHRSIIPKSLVAIDEQAFAPGYQRTEVGQEFGRNRTNDSLTYGWATTSRRFAEDPRNSRIFFRFDFNGHVWANVCLHHVNGVLSSAIVQILSARVTHPDTHWPACIESLARFLGDIPGIRSRFNSQEFAEAMEQYKVRFAQKANQDFAAIESQCSQYLTHYHNSLDRRRELMAIRDQVQAQIEKIQGNLYDQIMRLPHVVDVFFRNDTATQTHYIEVHTDEICVVDPRTKILHSIGEFKILANITRAELTRWHNKTRSVDAFRHKCQAPHVWEDGRACLGNAGPMMTQLLSSGMLLEYIGIVIEFVTTVNVDDPAGSRIDRWPVKARPDSTETK